MFSPKDEVAEYFGRSFKTPEGLLLFFFVALYFLMFCLFGYIKNFLYDLGVVLGNGYRLSFLLMPFALIGAYLRMDYTARSVGDRLLTAVVILAISSIPFLKLFIGGL